MVLKYQKALKQSTELKQKNKLYALKKSHRNQKAKSRIQKR